MMKSVRTRIMTTMCILVVVALLIVAATSVYLNVQTTNGTLEQTMQELAKISAKQVSSHLRAYRIIVESAARDERIFDPTVSNAEKQSVIDEITSSYDDLTRGNILKTSGDSIFDENNYSDREYFQKAMQGQTWISEPIVSKVTGKLSLIIAAPIWENGIHNTTIIGVLYLVPTETFLNDIVSDIKISAGAGAQIINRSGTVIAHPNIDLVMQASNAQENEKTDPAIKPIAALEREMMAGKTGFGTYSMFGVDKFLGYAPVGDSDGWSLGVNAPVADFMSYTYTSITIIAILLVLAIAAAVIVSVKLANGIGKPLKSMTDTLAYISETGSVEIGADDARQEAVYAQRPDEIGRLAHAAESLIQMLTDKVGTLDAIANGDLTTKIVLRSEGDAIGNALSKMTANLNDMFIKINSASSQVTNGSAQIANGSQALAQGSVEQSASVEQLSASINTVSEKTSHNAAMAKEAAELSDTIKHNAQKGSEQMEQMMQAVKDINEASNSIGKVMKAIDDIAFQTNILALNAAVEAARAGQHGKGFAVVADEVRSLAAKSAEAAKDTGSMISNSIEKSNLGYQIATETSSSLQEIVGGIERSAAIVDEIASLSNEQAISIDEINKGIEQVAQVVHQNSATAEESAAASQEMSDQSGLLQRLIGQFKIKQDSGHSASYSEPQYTQPAQVSHIESPAAVGFSLGDSDKY